MHILVIEDDAEVRDMVCKMLKDEEYEVVSAINGREGMELLRNESNIDLVITDILMPEKEGIETIRELKRDYPSIKILAISGGSRFLLHDFLRCAKLLGADLTLSKPFVKKDLLKVVKLLLE